jgi:hypothetical protein
MAEVHQLADAARTLFRELTEAGRPVVGVACGEGRIILRATTTDAGAPESYRGYPVTVITDAPIRK